MKKFLSFILVICLLIPMSLTFSACEFLNPPNGTPATTPTTPTVDEEETEEETPIQIHPLHNKTFEIKKSSLSWAEGTTELEKKQEMSALGALSEKDYFEYITLFSIPKVGKYHFKEDGTLDAYADGALANGTYTLEGKTLTVTIEETVWTGTMGNNSFSVSSLADDSKVIITLEFEQTTEGIKYPTMSGTYIIESSEVSWAEGLTDEQKATVISENFCSSEAELFEAFTPAPGSESLTFDTLGNVTYKASSGFLNATITAVYTETDNIVIIIFLGEPFFTLTKTDDKLVCTKEAESEPNIIQTSVFTKEAK